MMPRPLFVRDGHPDRPQRVIYDEPESDVDFTSVDFEMKRKEDDETDENVLERRGTNDVDITANPSGDAPAPPKDGLVLGLSQIKLMLVPDKPPAPPPPPAKEKKPHPQAKMKKFWKNFDPEYTGKVTRVLPDRITEKDLSAVTLVVEIAHKAIKSYEDAKESCIRDVKRIIKECRTANQKYTDSHWDIERDLKITRIRDCLDGLVVDDDDREHPADAKRVTVSIAIRSPTIV